MGKKEIYEEWLKNNIRYVVKVVRWENGTGYETLRVYTDDCVVAYLIAELLKDIFESGNIEKGKESKSWSYTVEIEPINIYFDILID